MYLDIKQAAYYPADLRRIAAIVTRRCKLASPGTDHVCPHWIKVGETGASLIVRGVSRVDGQAKTITIAL